MNEGGMTLIVKQTARLISGFITVFAIHIALTGHISPGGGFAGGVILAAAAVLIVLSFGKAHAAKVVADRSSHIADAAGAMMFLAVALLGYLVGGFFIRFLPQGNLFHLVSGGTIPLSNFAILVKVGAGLAGGFLALSAFRLARGKREGT